MRERPVEFRGGWLYQPKPENRFSEYTRRRAQPDQPNDERASSVSDQWRSDPKERIHHWELPKSKHCHERSKPLDFRYYWQKIPFQLQKAPEQAWVPGSGEQRPPDQPEPAIHSTRAPSRGEQQSQKWVDAVSVYGFSTPGRPDSFQPCWRVCCPALEQTTEREQLFGGQECFDS